MKRPGVKGQAMMVGAFQDEAVPGVAAGDAAMVVASESSRTVPERMYAGITRNVRITNRAEKGARAGLPFMGCAGGRLYPEDADPDDESTWLQPGESMMVDREVAVFLCGDCFSETNAALDGPDIIIRYGDFQFQAPENGIIQGKNITRIPVGPPEMFPDLLVEQVDSRMRPVGTPVSMYDRYINEQNFHKRK